MSLASVQRWAVFKLYIALVCNLSENGGGTAGVRGGVRDPVQAPVHHVVNVQIAHDRLLPLVGKGEFPL